MRRTLTEAEWARAITDFEHTAFRLELQPRYDEPGEAEAVQRFVGGDRSLPVDDPEEQAWLAYVEDRTSQGQRIERVRVVEDPPTDYQRWLRWVSQLTVAAGEAQRYLTRARAHEIGLLPAAGTEDWWLLDSCRLVVMRFDSHGRRIENELVTDPARVVRACAWRDLAVHHSVLERVQERAA